MTTDQVANVFDDFYRTGNSNTAISGLGLGIGIVRQIVLEHGGDIWVESFPDVGTNVYFTLPVDYCNSKSMDPC
jgi:two-component system sensor histidine kinase VicK